MQKYLNKISPEQINYVINRLNTNIPKLMVDIYGNYFCQKLIQCCSSEQRLKILIFVIKYNPDIIKSTKSDLVFLSHITLPLGRSWDSLFIVGVGKRDPVTVSC